MLTSASRNRLPRITVALGSVLACFVLHGAALGAEKPNIVFILIDDMGWNGPSCFGNPIVKTPNIDRLAAEGMKFTDAYAMPQCSPTRAAFLSGQCCARTKFTAVAHERHILPFAAMIPPEPVRKLPSETYTIATTLRDQGYAAGISGKWHVDNF